MMTTSAAVSAQRTCLLFVLATTALLQGCATLPKPTPAPAPAPGPAPPPVPGPTPSGNSGPSFVAVGDWGGHSDEQPTTAGQTETAVGMGKIAQALGVDSIFMLGDNFYEAGVTTCSSPRFQETFEDVYGAQEPLKNLTFHVIAGNHDHRGSIEAQIKYKGSTRWSFPATHYVLPKTWRSSSGEQRSIDFLFIDTVELVGNSDGEFGHRRGHELRDPADPLRAENQWAWVEQRLKSSTADFLWVVGHYPIYSAGNDGTTRGLVDRLLPLLKAHGAHYLSGHDHMFEHVEYDGVHMFLAGAGRECCYPATRLSSVPQGAIKFMISGDRGKAKSIGNRTTQDDIFGGFASLRFSDEHAQISFHTQDGSVLHAAPPVPRRLQALRVRAEEPSVVV